MICHSVHPDHMQRWRVRAKAGNVRVAVRRVNTFMENLKMALVVLVAGCGRFLSPLYI